MSPSPELRRRTRKNTGGATTATRTRDSASLPASSTPIIAPTQTRKTTYASTYRRRTFTAPAHLGVAGPRPLAMTCIKARMRRRHRVNGWVRRVVHPDGPKRGPPAPDTRPSSFDVNAHQWPKHRRAPGRGGRQCCPPPRCPQRAAWATQPGWLSVFCARASTDGPRASPGPSVPTVSRTSAGGA